MENGWSVEPAAHALGVSGRQVRGRIASGQLPYVSARRRSCSSLFQVTVACASYPAFWQIA